jgi:hypothetical protein
VPHVLAGAGTVTALTEVGDIRPGRLWTVRVRCVVDGWDHAVTDDNMAAGIAAGQGRYRAMCGVVITPDALTVPPGHLCPRCRTVAYPPPAPKPTGQVLARRGHRRPGVLRQLICRRRADRSYGVQGGR